MNNFHYTLFIRDNSNKTLTLNFNVNSIKILGGLFFFTIDRQMITERQEAILFNLKDVLCSLYLIQNSTTIGFVNLKAMPQSIVKLDSGEIMFCMRPSWI